MSYNNYTIKELTDFFRLNELNSLVHDTLVESKHIKKRTSGLLDLYPKLNKIKQTTILIAELNNKIAGTNSMTIDSLYGLHTNFFFKEETSE